MKPIKDQVEWIRILAMSLQWLVISLLVGSLAGSASALFLLSLDGVTAWRESHRWVIAFLPVGGLILGSLYHTWGRSIEAGHHLILEEIHHPKATLPFRLAPLILLGTLITHFFGGSAGREGTAVQMGASLADQLNILFKLSPKSRQLLLMAGISAGFASVFGTPLAGAVFGLEVLAIGRLRWGAILPCMLSALIGHKVTMGWGISHTHYEGLIQEIPRLSFSKLFYALLAGAVFGSVGLIFSSTVKWIEAQFGRWVLFPPLRLFWGGLILAGVVWAMGTTRYVGLGVPVITSSFRTLLPPTDFLLKILFTAWTLGCGFKGGEVTPLFFIGSTLGNALSRVIALPMPLLSGMGFVAVFTGAAKTPIAATIMAVELFGGQVTVYAALACVSAYFFSGRSGIYRAQKKSVDQS